MNEGNTEARRSIFRDGIHFRLGIFKDFWSAVSHFAGFIAAIVGLVALLLICEPGAARITSSAIYGGSLVALFAASATYHFFDLGEAGNRFLRRLDHIGIYLLITGTYVPGVVLLTEGAWRVTLLSIIAAFAVAGVVLKVLWLDCPEKLSTALYLAFGWFAIVPILVMFPLMTITDFVLLISGGIAYTMGAVVFWREWPDPWPERFGHHEVWHLFVLCGATLHWFFVAGLVSGPIA